MKYVKQIGIVLGITMAGEVLYQVLPLPVPAGVYGLFIMLAALMGGAVKLESVEGTGNFRHDHDVHTSHRGNRGIHSRGQGCAGSVPCDHSCQHRTGHDRDRPDGPVGHGAQGSKAGD